jgi:hypothetical protein
MRYVQHYSTVPQSSRSGGWIARESKGFRVEVRQALTHRAVLTSHEEVITAQSNSQFRYRCM